MPEYNCDFMREYNCDLMSEYNSDFMPEYITKGESFLQYIDFFSGDLPVLAVSTAFF